MFFKKLIKKIEKVFERTLNNLFQNFRYNQLDMKTNYMKIQIDRFLSKAAEDNAIFYENKSTYYESITEFANKLSTKNKCVFLEFGVYKGDSLKVLSENCQYIDFYGFDSFEGFKEPKTISFFWKRYQDEFSKDYNLPEFSRNVKILEGFVEETFNSDFINELKKYDIVFIHFDLDIYAPTSNILKKLDLNQNKYFFMFDELLNYEDFLFNEFRAFQEEVIEKKIQYKILKLTQQFESFNSLGKVFIEILS